MRCIGLRHGQSEYNLRGLCNDDPARRVVLTDVGRRQARAISPSLRERGIEQVFSSPLPRAVQTAELAIAGMPLAVTLDERLADIRSGFDGRAVVDYLTAIAADPVHTRVNGGESLIDYHARVNGFLDWLADRPWNCVLLVAHEETLRVFKARSESLAPAQVFGLPFSHCVPYVFAL